jgi:hypothetical protein
LLGCQFDDPAGLNVERTQEPKCHSAKCRQENAEKVDVADSGKVHVLPKERSADEDGEMDDAKNLSMGELFLKKRLI